MFDFGETFNFEEFITSFKSLIENFIAIIKELIANIRTENDKK